MISAEFKKQLSEIALKYGYDVVESYVDNGNKLFFINDNCENPYVKFSITIEEISSTIA